MDDSNMSFKDRATAIETDCKKLLKQCENPEQMKEIDKDEIVRTMEYMVVNIAAPNGTVFEMGLYGHLLVMTKLAGNDAIQSVEHFTDVTKLMCDLCSKPGVGWKYVSDMLVHWLDFVERLSCAAKMVIFTKLQFATFVKCAQFLIDAPSISSKFVMLNILCAYIQADPNPIKKLCSLFDGMVEQSTMNIINSVNWANDGLLLNNKFRILDRINHVKQTIYPELIESVDFGDDGKITIKCDDRRLYFNKVAKTLEFWMTHNSNMMLVTISARRLKNVQITDSGHCFVQRLKLILNMPPRVETANGKKMASPDLRVTTIAVNFEIGVYKPRLNSMLLDMFEIVPETLNESNETGAELNHSDVLEVVDLPTGTFQRSNRIITRSSNVHSVVAKEKRAPPKAAETISQATTKRGQRVAAQRAVLGIYKSLEDTASDSNDVDTKCAPSRKVNKKPPSPVSLYTGIVSMKKPASGAVKWRKLWSSKQNPTQSNNNNDSDTDAYVSDESKRSPIKRHPIIKADVLLTPVGFQKSICNNPEQQKSRMLKNASLINERVKRNDGTF